MSMSSPPDAAGSAGGDPTAGAGGDDQDQDQSSGYTISIMVTADNKISLSVAQGTDDDSDGDDDSSQGGSGDSDGDSQAMQISSLNDLVSTIKSIVRSGGQMESEDDQAQFAAGAGEGSGQ